MSLAALHTPFIAADLPEPRQIPGFDGDLRHRHMKRASPLILVVKTQTQREEVSVFHGELVETPSRKPGGPMHRAILRPLCHAGPSLVISGV